MADKTDLSSLKEKASATFAEASEKKLEPVKDNSKMYYSKSPQHRIGADKIQPEIRNSVTGDVIAPSGVIRFYANVYKTGDKKEQDLIESTPEFQRGMIKEITMAEYAAILKSKNAVHRMQASDLNEINKVRETTGG